MSFWKSRKRESLKFYVCFKCNVPTTGDIHCVSCRTYIEAMDRKKIEEAEAKEELKRRSWIKVRDKFLEDNNL